MEWTQSGPAWAASRSGYGCSWVRMAAAWYACAGWK